MNKTVNINLAGIFFHIDEDAYLKLQRYLEAIKRSFTDSQGRSEIIADIEARIAELFTERVQFDKQVIGVKLVDEVIAIMGQPEDYLVDDEIFEDGPTTSRPYKTQPSKKLYRDTDNSYIAGVSSGLGHYLGIDAVWVRLLWILLTIGSGGTFILVYILFWVLVPEATTTSEKLIMTGEAVNISNIEKKIKDGFDNVSQTVSDTVKNVDFQKHGNKIKSSTKTFFDTLGDVVMFFLKVFAKFVGVILLLTGAVAIFALFISLISIGSISNVHPMWMDYVNAVNTVGLPIWLGSLIIFLLIGIPLFFLLYLGLKILINNLKSMGRVAKFSLLGVWLLALIGVLYIGLTQASYYSLENSSKNSEELYINSIDTLSVKMNASNMDYINKNMYRNHGFDIAYDEEGNKMIYSKNVSVAFKSTSDSIGRIEIIKEAKGRNFAEAKKTADEINYVYNLKGDELLLDNFLVTDHENKFMDQNVRAVIYIPEGKIIKVSDNLRSFLNHYATSESIISNSYAGHYVKIIEDEAVCLDCEEDDQDDDFTIRVDIKDERNGLKINENGVEFKQDSLNVKVNEGGVDAEGEDLRLKVSSDTIELTSDDN